MIWWRVMANYALARTGGCLNVPPSEARKFCISCNWNRAIWWIPLGANLEQVLGKKKKKKKQLFGPDWPKFCILGEIFDKILLESLKISRFRAKSVDFVWIFVKIRQKLFTIWGGGWLHRPSPLVKYWRGYIPPSPGSTPLKFIITLHFSSQTSCSINVEFS